MQAAAPALRAVWRPLVAVGRLRGDATSRGHSSRALQVRMSASVSTGRCSIVCVVLRTLMQRTPLYHYNPALSRFGPSGAVRRGDGATVVSS